ncbi:MAG: methyltransferase domain-containing protein [Desulfurococcaceae archaeon]|jgi:ribosomal protein L11 methylase PrmA|nr:methyltransferase domain-containing protein [Desulfurococcaceae archaeon]
MVYVPYVPTPYAVVRAMLKLANTSPQDVVYDLGCGDGRILLIAAKEFGVKKAVGIEKDPERYKVALTRVREEGLENKVEIRLGDFFDENISDATVVTIFLLTSVNELLKPKFERELKPGTRIVSHEFRIPGWRPERVIDVRDENGLSHIVYLYVLGRHL